MGASARGFLHRLPRHARHAAGIRSALAGLQAQPPVHLRQVPRQHGLTGEYRMRFPDVATQYQDSIHGEALLKKGLIVAPSCNDCHGVHDIKRSVDRSSPINKANLADTCGKCHVGVEETYNKSVHGQLLPKGDSRGAGLHRLPHRARDRDPHEHPLQAGQRPALRQVPRRTASSTTATPITARRWRSASRTSPATWPPVTTATATTTSCRRPIPHRTLSKANILADLPPSAIPAPPSASPNTIRTPTRWTAKNYPALHLDLRADDRAAVRRVHLLRRPHAAVAGPLDLALPPRLEDLPRGQVQTQRDDEWFTRFTPFERFLHFLVVTSFLLLVITGMPLKFYYTDWAKAMFHVIGGAADRARAAPLRRDRHLPLFRPAPDRPDRHGMEKPRRHPRSGNRQIELKRALARRLRSGLDGAHAAGLAGFRGPPEMVLRQGTEAAVRPLDLLGEVRLLRRVLGRLRHRPVRADHVVPAVLHALPARLDHQHRADHPLGRSAAGGRIHLHHPFLQHPFPAGEIPDGHRDLLRPHLEERNAARAQALV